MKVALLPDNRCITCGELLNAATDPKGNELPRPGDLSMCLHCGVLMVFTDTMKLRALTDAEMLEIEFDPDVLRLQHAQRMTAGQKRKRQ